jgi:succinate dehydrogenase / fumarate reductase cytochrome b subunit
MAASNRPLSPHLQIYRLQITSVLSILHRITGVALAVGVPLLVWWLAAAALGPDAFETVCAFWGSWFGQLLLLGWTFALFYHLCNGIRHLAWDLGYGFDPETAALTGWLVVAGAGGLTLVTWVFACSITGAIP